MRQRIRSASHLYAYFRGSEYPPGRVRGLWDAWTMAKRWPWSGPPLKLAKAVKADQ